MQKKSGVIPMKVFRKIQYDETKRLLIFTAYFIEEIS